MARIRVRLVPPRGDVRDLLGGVALLLVPERTVTEFPYVWAWGQRGYWTAERVDGVLISLVPPRVFDRCRKGERCRLLVRGQMNSALLEFEDGFRVVTSRNGLRRAAA